MMIRKTPKKRKKTRYLRKKAAKVIAVKQHQTDSKREPMLLRPPSELRQKIIKEAQAQGLSVNAMVIQILEKYFEELQKSKRVS